MNKMLPSPYHFKNLLPVFRIIVCFSFVWFSGIRFPLLAEEVDSTGQFLGTYYKSLADQLFIAKELPGNLESALENYQKAARYVTQTKETDWKITRCYWVLATKASSPQKREAYFKEGMRFGKQAVKNNQDSSYAHSWLALMIGSSAMDEGVVKTLYNKEIIRSGFETAITLNPENTNAHVGLAGWYFHVPGLFGGDKQKALQLIQQAIELEPDYTAPQIMKAEFLIAEHNYPEAIRTLKGVLAVKQPVIRGDGVEDKLKAEKMLQDLNRERAFD